MHQKGAASLHLATCRRDAEAGAPSIVPLRQHTATVYCTETVDLEAADVKQ